METGSSVYTNDESILKSRNFAKSSSVGVDVTIVISICC